MEGGEGGGSSRSMESGISMTERRWGEEWGDVVLGVGVQVASCRVDRNSAQTPGLLEWDQLMNLVMEEVGNWVGGQESLAG